MRGRRPKPTALKLRQGNPGGRALNRREPKPVISAPTCPAHLSPSAKAEWKRLAHQLTDLGILSQLDRAALAGYCQAWGRWVEAERKLKETPILLRTPAGYVQPSPWLAIANKQLELMHRFMGELGLSPASRSRVATFPSLTPKPWEDYGPYGVTSNTAANTNEARRFGRGVGS
jgi:P27 family predicted phage terminase small subunit